MKNTVEQLESDIKRAEAKQKDVPRQLQAFEAQVDKLRARRTELLASCGLGEPNAIDEVSELEKKITDLLREKQRTIEVALELDSYVKTKDAALLRLLVEEVQDDLPKLKETVNTGIRAISKSLSDVDFSAIGTAARYFGGVGQAIEQELRQAIGQAIRAAVEGLITDPTRPPVINSQGVEAVLKQALKACDKQDSELQAHLTSARQYALLQRRRLEAQTVL